MQWISSKAAGGLQNRYKFNDGTELESGEFSDGSGLELYATDYRSYDPQIGRFHQIDPLADEDDSWSPYTFALDNPIYFNDPLGLLADSLRAPDGKMVVDNGSMENITITSKTKSTASNTTTPNVQPVYNTPQWNPVVVTPKPNSNQGSMSILPAITVTARANPEAVVITLGVGFLYAAYLAYNNPSSSQGPIYWGSPDNTLINRPNYILKAEDKTDHMGKPKGNTPGNNQAQNKQVESLSKKYKLSRDEQQRLHRRISGEGYGYKEIEEIIKTKDY